ncbi:nuclear transport factor 2 family protein [Gordonia soli]|uniref:SnoaL-like domain-containing protein n=1 Tax=Gordonia soli NBRC 108243 TaxID=1223545 RepID=M0QKB9_9ACTN|nr:nuclear transport factor 2 family protein [Gordonia soli]GAC68879.1 hypothetical protein GS4_19_00690 [Gordonia soli NBRC 108243]
MPDAHLLTNLLYRYAELVDAGDLEGVGELFADAEIVVDGTVICRGADGIVALLGSMVRIHADGTPRTKHIITNPIVEFGPHADRATVRSYYTVVQQTDRLPLQIVAAGRYRDEFRLRDGHWRFAVRDYSYLDFVGDVGDHLLGGR